MKKDTNETSVIPFWIVTAISILLVLFCTFTFINAEKARQDAAAEFEEATNLMNETDAETDEILGEIARLEFETEQINEANDAMTDRIEEERK